MVSITQNPMIGLLPVPTINDEPVDFINLFGLWQTTKTSKSSEFIFDFSSCRFLRQNAVAFLGGLARHIEARGGKAIFNWDTLRGDIQGNLEQNGFCAAFGKPGGGWQGNSIPYREDPQDNLDGIVDYLERQWLGRDWVKTDDDIKNQIVCTVLEIYSNAFEHGRSEIGVFSCGQRYPGLNLLKLTAIDFGVGIPPNVRQFLQKPTMRTEDALRWAFQFGKTTRQNAIPGGTGLDMLRSFIKEKKGKIEIYSHDGYVLISETQELYSSAPTYFDGTLMNITLRCEPAYYN
jgi:signal transduction histidine kinase